MPRAPRQGRLAPQHARVPAQRHSPTHLHVLAHVQQAIHELGRELLSLSLWPSPSLVCSVLLDRRSPIAKSGALSLRAPMYARERTSLHIYASCSRSRSFAVDFYFRLDFPGPEVPHSLLRPPRSFREPLNSRRRINLESDRVDASLLHRRCINSVWLPETFYKFG